MPPVLLIIFGFTLAIFFGFAIYYSERMRKLAEVGLGVILASFFLGIITLVCVII